jgi:hypothetical protein
LPVHQANRFVADGTAATLFSLVGRREQEILSGTIRQGETICINLA